MHHNIVLPFTKGEIPITSVHYEGRVKTSWPSSGECIFKFENDFSVKPPFTSMQFVKRFFKELIPLQKNVSKKFAVYPSTAANIYSYD